MTRLRVPGWGTSSPQATTEPSEEASGGRSCLSTMLVSLTEDLAVEMLVHMWAKQIRGLELPPAPRSACMPSLTTKQIPALSAAPCPASDLRTPYHPRLHSGSGLCAPVAQHTGRLAPKRRRPAQTPLCCGCRRRCGAGDGAPGPGAAAGLLRGGHGGQRPAGHQRRDGVGAAGPAAQRLGPLLPAQGAPAACGLPCRDWLGCRHSDTAHSPSCQVQSLG